MSHLLDSLLDAERKGQCARNDTYAPLVPHSVMLDMAEEKLCADAENFNDWLYSECLGPTPRRPCHFFGPISTVDLLTEVLLKTRATNEQLAAAVRELRARFIGDNADFVRAEFDRLRSEEQQ